LTSRSRAFVPAATASSALLHAGLLVALLPTVLPQQVRLTEQLVEVTFDPPSPPIEAPALAAASDRAARNVTPGMDEREQRTAKQDQRQPAAAPTPVPTEPDIALILPSVEPPPSVTARDFANSAAAPAREPNHEKILPPVTAPSPLTGHDFARIAPPASPTSPQVQQPTQAPQPQQPVRESRPKRAARQATADGTDGKAPDTPSPLTKATTDHSHRQAQQDYLWQIIRKLSQVHFYGASRDEIERGLVVTRLTVARDGRLVGVAVTRPSGFPNLDRAVLDTVRRASPFPPLPTDFAVDNYSFIVPISYAQQR